MKKKRNRILGLICYALGIICALYVGGYLMLIKPIQVLIAAYYAGTLTYRLLIIKIIQIALSTTFAGFVWCVGYIGYNHFEGTEDPDWEAIELKWQEKKRKKESKEK